MRPERASLIRWAEPPPSRSSSSNRPPSQKYLEIADLLRAHPGRWAVVSESTGRLGSSLASYIGWGGGAFAPAGDFEAVVRLIEGTTTVYARYLGDGEAGA